MSSEEKLLGELKRLRIVVREQQKEIQEKTARLEAVERDSRALFSNWNKKVLEKEKQMEQRVAKAEEEFNVALVESKAETDEAMQECEKLRMSLLG